MTLEREVLSVGSEDLGSALRDVGLTVRAAAPVSLVCAYHRKPAGDDHSCSPTASVDLRRLLVRSGADASVVVWELAAERDGVIETSQDTFVPGGCATCAACSDGRPIPFGAPEHARLWRRALRRLRADLEVRAPGARLVVVTPASGPDEADLAYLDAMAAVPGISVLRGPLDEVARRVASVHTRRITSRTQAAPEPPPVAPSVVDHGPLPLVSVRVAAVGWDADTRPQISALLDGSPARAVRLGGATSTPLTSADDPAHRTGSALLVAGGRVFGSFRSPNDATLWELDDGGLRTLATRLAGEEMIRTLARDVDGRLVATTYPHGRLVRVDPDTADVEDLGRVADDAVYAWGLAVTDDGYWVGTGPHPHIVHVDRRTGARTSIGVPGEDTTESAFVVGVVVRPDALHVGLTTDPSAGARWWTRRTDGTWFPRRFGADDPPLRCPAVGEDGLLHGVVADQVVRADLDAPEGPTQPLPGGPPPDVCRRTVHLAVSPDGSEVVGVTSDGASWSWRDGATSTVHHDLPPTAGTVNCLSTSGDRLVAGTFLGPGAIGVTDATRPRVDVLPGPGQVDVVVEHGADVLLASYPGVTVRRGRLSSAAPYRWVAPDRVLGSVGRDAGLDRPTSMVVRSGEVVVGAVARYGVPGGGLAFVDLDGGPPTTADPVPGQSVTALTTVGEWVVGGTSVHGGTGSTPSSTTARLFALGAGSRSPAWCVDLPDGSETVLGLAPAPDGRIHALVSSGALLLVDPDTGTVVDGVQVDRSRPNRWGVGAGLTAGPEAVYAWTGGRLLSVGRDLDDVRVLVPRGVRHAACTSDGTVYVSDGRAVGRLTATT